MTALAVKSPSYDVEPLGPAEKAEVVDALYKHFSMQKVCKETGYDLRRIMSAIDEDPDFANAINLAEKHLSVIGEDELKRRAIFGVESVVVANGRVVYEVKDGERRPMVETKYSDALLKTYLEANRRDKFGAKLEVTTTHKGSIALPIITPEMMRIILAEQRGETVELIADDSMEADAAPEVIDADYEVVSHGQDGETADQTDAGAVPSADGGDDPFDILT